MIAPVFSETTPIPFEGGCLCGAVRYRVSENPLTFVVCHCRDCQYASGGAAANVLVVPQAGLALTAGVGALGSFRSLADSGRAVTRQFCSVCGTPMFEVLEADASIRLVKAGTLDDPSGLVIDATVWTASAQPWAHIDAATKQYERDLPFPFVRRNDPDAAEAVR